MMNFRRGLAAILICATVLGALRCTRDPRPPQPNAAQRVIDEAIAAHGMDRLDNFSASFRFRERQYTIERSQDGRFVYTRNFVDTLGASVIDSLTNDGLLRYVDGELFQVTDEDRVAYANSVNSVRYFFMLPYGLNDPAVQSELLSPTTIAGQAYNRLKVTFAPEGGGTDFDDVYHYFFNQETEELDYLAYAFEVNDGGIRFREAINRRRVGGVLIQDYSNYGVDGEDRDLADIDRRFENGELPLLSVIENTEVVIE